MGFASGSGMYDPRNTSGESRSPWRESARRTPAQGVAPQDRKAGLKDGSVDVLVVGAGIAGLSTAYHALYGGSSVVVVDRGDVACGETARSTAHVSSALDDRYFKLEEMHGEVGAQLAAQSHTAAISSIEAIIQREGIVCDFKRVDGYLFNDSGLNDGGLGDGGSKRDVIERELEATRRAGLDVEMVLDAPLPFGTGPALCFHHQAQFEPVAYLQGLARAVVERGGKLWTHLAVTKIEEGSPVRVTFEDGTSLQAKTIVIATNTPIIDVLAMHTKQAAYRTYAVGIAIAKGSITRALFWDTESPYHYIRLAGDDDLLIVGGEDHKVGQSAEPEQSWARLEEWARARFPNIGDTRYRWSGQVWEPMDGLAFIGRNAGSASNVLIATGDSGNGITHGALAGIILSDRIANRENPWEQLYDPSRKMTQPTAALRLVRENLNVALSYGGHVGSALDEHVEGELAPGHGMIERRGLRRVAVYMDEAGARHECSAVCTHLGGPLHWNRAERSWDCPCHGARFDPYGRVMTGPAISDLHRVEPAHADQAATRDKTAAE